MWTPAQADVLNFKLFPQVAVFADAGSGKTTTLVERAMRILRSQKGDDAKQKILCVSFTEKSIFDLKRRFFKQPDLSLNDIDVFTFHGLCWDLIKECSDLRSFSLASHLQIQEILEEISFKTLSSSSVYENLDFSFQQVSELIRYLCLEKRQARILNHPELMDSVEKARILFQQSKNQKSLLDYQDLETLALDRLKKGQIRRFYEHIFVDEFQDTALIQCELLSLLKGMNHQTFMVVGDEKQSIYRFRGAQVDTFSKFSKSLKAQIFLDTNFRSNPEILNAINLVFENHFRPMIAGKQASQNSISSILTFEDQEEKIPFLIKKIKKEGRPLKDIVLLLPKLVGFQSLFESLRRANIPFIIKGSSHQDPQIAGLVYLWLAVVDSGQSWWRYQAEALLGQKRFEFSLTLHKVFCNYSDALHEWNSLAQRWHLLDQNVFHVQSLIEEAELSGMSLQESLSYFRKALEGDVPLDLGTQNQGNDDVLRVMTVHASKGLEFPCVILAGLQQKTHRSYGGILRTASGDILLSQRNDRGALDKTPEFLEAAEFEKNLQQAESLRLLYVALTRAQEQLILWNEGKKDTEETWRAWLEPLFSEGSFLGQELEESLSLDVSEHSTIDLSSHSLMTNSISQTHHVEPLFKKSKTWLKNPDPIRKGIQLHQCLEWDDMKNLEVALKSMGFSEELFLNWLKSSEGQSLFWGESNLDKNHQKIFKEFGLAYWGQDRKRFEQIRIDRIVLDLNRCVILDYKFLFSNVSTEAYSELHHQYSSQLLHYERVLRQARPDWFKNRKFEAAWLDVLGSTGKICHFVNTC